MNSNGKLDLALCYIRFGDSGAGAGAPVNPLVSIMPQVTGTTDEPIGLLAYSRPMVDEAAQAKRDEEIAQACALQFFKRRRQ